MINKLLIDHKKLFDKGFIIKYSKRDFSINLLFNLL